MNHPIASITTQMTHYAGLAKIKYAEIIRDSVKIILEPSTEKFIQAAHILTYINRSIGADVIGAGHGSCGAYVFGKDGVPWGVLTLTAKYGGGDSEAYWELYSKYIDKKKGPKQVVRSKSHTGVINFLRKGIVKPISMEEMFDIGGFVAHKIKNLSFEKEDNRAPFMDHEVRSSTYQYLADTLEGKNPSMPEDLIDWTKNVSILVNANRRLVEQRERTKDSFRKRSIVLSYLPFATDKSIHVAELSVPIGGNAQMRDGGFINKVEDLVEFPHIVGINNLVKLEFGGKGQIFHNLTDYGYNSKYNLFRTHSSNNEFMNAISIAFPAEFLEEQSQPTQETMPVDNKEIFSLDI